MAEMSDEEEEEARRSIGMNALVCKCAGTIMWEVDRNIKVTRSVRFDET